MDVESFAERCDRPFAVRINDRERAPGGRLADHGLDAKTERLQPCSRRKADLVVSERREERASACELRELHGGDRSASRRLFPPALVVHDLAGRWRVVDARERHPLDVSDYRDPHARECGILDGWKGGD